MATPADVKDAILKITGKTLTDPQLIQAATLYNESFGGQWSVDANPYDPDTEPAEHAGWPGNATVAQVADFFAIKTRSHWQSRVWRGKKNQVSAANESGEDTAAQAEADVL